MFSRELPYLRKPNPFDIRPWQKESHLHEFRAVPNPEGNRAERRVAEKLKRKKKS